MQSLRNLFTAIRLLGVFGFILVCSTIIIGLSVYNIFLLDEGIVKLNTHTERRFALENIVSGLIELEIAERQIVLRSDRAQILINYEQTNEALDNYFLKARVAGNPQAELDLLDADRRLINGSFTDLVSNLEVGIRPDETELRAILREQLTLNQQLDDLIFKAKIDLEEDFVGLEMINKNANIVSIIGLIIFPLLAIWAFLLASRITHPILLMTNAIVAIEGNHYRPEYLGTIINHRDRLGLLARDLDQMATAISAREASLEEEIKNLREELQDVRQRKIMPSSAIHQQSGKE